MDIDIRDYRDEDEAVWLACWGQVVVASHAWGLSVYQAKPRYRRPAVELVAVSRPGAWTPASEAASQPGAFLHGFIDVEIEAVPGELGLGRETRCGFVWELGLTPAWRGCGLGRRLVEAAADRLRALGIRRMEFWSMDENAQRFYEHLGMVEINRHWRFWMRPGPGSTGLASALLEGAAARAGGGEPSLPQSLHIDLIQATANVADWPAIRDTGLVVDTPPLEPHLCRGFDYRF